MRKALTFSDAKANKFWRIATLDEAYVVHYGKSGTYGKFQIKESDDEEQCLKQAERAVAAKLKKGYTVEKDFDFTQTFYFDDAEYGPHPLTSHPNFIKHFRDSMYYSVGDEETPFGSDAGHDTLTQIEEDLRSKKAFDWNSFPQRQIETYWDLKYLPPTASFDREAFMKRVKTDDEYRMNVRQTDQVLTAVAFGQIKITGMVSPELKRLALLAMDRLECLAEAYGHQAPSKIVSKMIRDLTGFPATP